MSATLQSCSSKEEPFLSNLSTPQETLKTSIYAATHRMPDLFLDCLSNEIRSTYGKTKAEQLRYVKKGFSRLKKELNIEVNVTQIHPIGESGDMVEVSFDKFQKGTLILKNGKTPMKRENGEWKIAMPKQATPTPEQIAEAEVTKKLLKSDFVLDEKTRSWVPVEKSNK